MYNRILHRPMFKLGGKTVDAQGTGITSGLDVPRQGYQEKGFVEKLSAIDVSVPESTRKRAFWSGIGEGFSNARTLGEALSGAVRGQSAILGPAEAAAGERRFELEKLGHEKEFDRETAQQITQLEANTDIRVAQIAAESTATAQRIKQLNLQFSTDGVVDRSDPAYQRNLNEIIRGFSKTESANKLMIAIINSGLATNETDALKMALKMILGAEAALLPGKATGGRIGYQLGATNQGVQPMQASLNVDETIQTPQGTMQEDVSVQEKIQPSVNMTYQEFRAKMPPQVDDEIVQLIYYNQDAFADFAQIKTQDEVYAFNNKYGVSLVLPFDTEIT
jgi:hypothetical protein